MGSCNSDEGYKYDVKGMNEKHQHMLIFTSPNMRDSKSFICSCCSKNCKDIASFHCIKCKFDMCKECFDYSGGIIFSLYKEGQKGQVNSHPEHVLVYGNTNLKGKSLVKLNGKILYNCSVCDACFLADYIKCWTCPLCNYDVCDKCFSEKGGKVYSNS